MKYIGVNITHYTSQLRFLTLFYGSFCVHIIRNKKKPIKIMTQMIQSKYDKYRLYFDIWHFSIMPDTWLSCFGIPQLQ